MAFWYLIKRNAYKFSLLQNIVIHELFWNLVPKNRTSDDSFNTVCMDYIGAISIYFQLWYLISYFLHFPQAIILSFQTLQIVVNGRVKLVLSFSLFKMCRGKSFWEHLCLRRRKRRNMCFCVCLLAKRF